VETSDSKAIGTAPTREERSHYLPFVDGLRAVSILAVVGFHVGVPGFSGGFVGVDIFFVISGFLICNQIIGALERDQFSILSFYARRGVRILPAYLLMLAVVDALAPFFLPTPGVYQDFLLAAALAPLMVSNVLFYLRQGYFDLAADQKPLLHTWTLSVEEQFYLVVPMLLITIFRLGRRRFGAMALGIAVLIAAASLAGAILHTTTSGRNPAFYLSYWRAWEFVAGALIGGRLVVMARRMPRALAEAIGIAGLAAILAAIVLIDARMPYPSWRAILPVAGASLLILAGYAQPTIIVARLLALRGFVGIGLVSYSWYLWHWPILSFLRISRVGETSLLPDLIGGGVVALALAYLSYRYVERPIRRWRPAFGDFKRGRRIVVAGAAACLTVAALGGASAFVGYLTTKSYVATRYGTEGQGVIDSDCHVVTTSTLPGHCVTGRYGVLIGDSHADALYGSFAKHFAAQGVRLIGIARGGCDPALFAPTQRRDNRRHGCANLLGPFETMMAAPTPPAFVIITSAWASRALLSQAHYAELVAQFDPRRTRVLLIGPVPMFNSSSLDCVVLSDWHRQSRDRCTSPRAAAEAARAPILDVLKATAARFANVRTIDPTDLFCDAQVCRPFRGDNVYYLDGGHVLPSGADRIYAGFADDFRWLTGSGG